MMRKDASYLTVGVAITMLVTAVGGGMYMGALAQEVEQLKTEHAEKNKDHDRIVTTETKVVAIEKDVDLIQQDIRTLLVIVRSIEQKVQ